MIWRNDLAERDRGVQRVRDDHVLIGDPEATHLLADPPPEGIVPNPCEGGAVLTESRCRDGNVHRGPTQELAEGRDLLQRHPCLQGINLHSAPTNCQNIMHD